MPRMSRLGPRSRPRYAKLTSAALAITIVIGVVVIGVAPTALAQSLPGPQPRPSSLAEGELPAAPRPPEDANPNPITPASPVGSAIAHHIVVRAYTNTHSISEAEAERRLELQSKGKHLAIRLRARFGRGLSQVSFDNDVGRYVVAISPKGDEQAVRAALNEFGLEGTKVERVELDHVELSERVAALSARVLEVIRAGHATVGLIPEGVQITVANSANAKGEEPDRRSCRSPPRCHQAEQRGQPSRST